MLVTANRNGVKAIRVNYLTKHGLSFYKMGRRFLKHFNKKYADFGNAAKLAYKKIRRFNRTAVTENMAKAEDPSTMT